MARGKRRSKRTGRRGRRVGALKMKKETTDILMLGLGAIGGAVAKRFLDTALAKQTAIQIDPKLLSVGEMLGGGVMAWALPNWFLKGVGIGIASEGGVTILQSMGVLSGITLTPDVPFMPRPNMGGLTRTQTIGSLNAYGFPAPNSVAGSRMNNATRFAGAY